MRTIWNNLQSSLWFRPIVAALLAIVLALGSTILDSMVTLPEIFYLAPDNARLILSAIANSMLTVVALTFSIIMIVLVLASQQFSPRILGNFARDQVSQNVLSIFIATFVYSLLVMGRINDTGNALFIPVLSVTVTIFLALLSVGALIYFIDRPVILLPKSTSKLWPCYIRYFQSRPRMSARPPLRWPIYPFLLKRAQPLGRLSGVIFRPLISMSWCA